MSAGGGPEREPAPPPPPQRLAPFSYALGAEVRHPETAIVPERSEGDAFGRLILLHDPDGAEAWDGTMRLVAYIQADLDPSEAVDPLLPEVAWSWLVDALEAHTEHSTALGGTVTHPNPAPTSWSCGRRGRRPIPRSAFMSRRSATCWSTPRAYHRPESPTWARGHAPDMGEPAADAPGGTEPSPTPLLH